MEDNDIIAFIWMARTHRPTSNRLYRGGMSVMSGGRADSTQGICAPRWKGYRVDISGSVCYADVGGFWFMVEAPCLIVNSNNQLWERSSYEKS